MSNEMYFDTDSFDFDSLTDIVFNDEPTRTLAQDLRQSPTINDDISDLTANPWDEPKEEQETDYNTDASDLNKPVIPDGVNITDYFNSADDNAILDLGGKFVSKAELADKITRLDKLERDEGYFTEQAQRFDADNKIINQRSLMKETVLERNVKVLSDRLNNPNLPDHEYASTDKQLKQAQAALWEHTQEVNQIMQTRAQQEQEINGFRIRAADQLIAEDVPQWNNPQFKQTILADILKDVPASVLEKVYDKGLMVRLMKGYLYDQNKARVQGELNQRNKTKTPNSLPSAGASKRNQKSSAGDPEKAKAVLSKMGTGRDANIQAFSYLKD